MRALALAVLVLAVLVLLRRGAPAAAQGTRGQLAPPQGPGPAGGRRRQGPRGFVPAS